MDEFVIVEDSPRSTNRSSSEIFLNPTTSKVFTTTLPDGKIVAWTRYHNATCDSDVRKQAEKFSGCRTCIARASRYVRYAGPQGPLLFQDEQKSTHDAVNVLKKHADVTCSGEDYKLVLIDSDTFPQSAYNGPGSRTNEKTFYHMSIKPDYVTDPELVNRMSKLWNNVQSSVETRLSKFFNSEARATMKIIERIINDNTLERPEYWAKTCDWIMNLLGKFKIDYDIMKSEMKEELCVYAMATGYAVNGVHYNFQTADNFVDFMVMETKEAIAVEMDKRSDPRTNQVSQLAKAKANHGVTSNYGIGLVWNGKDFKDDLDLRVKTPWGLVWYGKKELVIHDKQMAKLDFDAGIHGTEAEPAENVSLCDDIAGKTVTVEIDNYTRRTHGDVHCNIVITQKGNEDIVIPVTWESGRSKGDYKHVCSHTFTKIEEQSVELSEAKARAMLAQEKEFNALFGTPTSTVATLNDLIDLKEQLEYLCEIDCSDNSGKSKKSKENDDPQTVTAVLDELSSIALNATKSNSKSNGKKKKKYLSERMAERPPTTINELLDRLEEGTVESVTIHPQDYVPGYITKVHVDSDKALHGGTDILSCCHYQDKFQHPIKPIKQGNARLDSSWVPVGYGQKANVNYIAKIGDNYFFAIDGAQLSSDTDAFPQSAGFYPQDLAADGHKHRSKWSYLNTSVKPKVVGEKQAIGTFLTQDTATVTVDGQKLLLKVE